MADSWLSNAADLATLVALGLVFWGIALTRRAAINHVAAHLEAVRLWAAGPNGQGWSDADVTPERRLKWHHPRNMQLTQESAPALSQLSLVQNAAVPRQMAFAFVGLAQGIASFNQYLGHHAAFLTADLRTAAIISEKLDAATVTVLAGRGLPKGSPPPPDLTQIEFAAIIQAANFTADEFRCARFLAEMLKGLHTIFIGDENGRGVYRQMLNLERNLAGEGWIV